MSEPSKLSPEEHLAQARKCEAAVQRAVRDAVLASAYAGQPVSTWRDGKVVWLQPNEILAEFGLPPLGKKDDSLGAA